MHCLINYGWKPSAFAALSPKDMAAVVEMIDEESRIKAEYRRKMK